MRFITFEYQKKVRAGVLLPQASGQPAMLIDGAHPQRPHVLQRLEPTMHAWIRAGLVELSRALKQSAPVPGCLLPLEQVRLLAPLPRPGKVVGAAFNYRDGLQASGRPVPEEPVIFIKSGLTVIGPDEPLVLVRGNQVTYEAELAAIIGTQGLKVDKDAAMACVCGYAIFNDVSYTNYVREDGGFVRGKNQATSGPLGPWIVSADDIPDPMALAIELRVDGQCLQSSNTAQMLFDPGALIAYASARMPLDIGDVIATGTPVGVAANHTPPAWLTDGQTVSVHIEGLGELINPVIEKVSHV